MQHLGNPASNSRLPAEIRGQWVRWMRQVWQERSLGLIELSTPISQSRYCWLEQYFAMMLS
jgi:hypothetical protein